MKDAFRVPLRSSQLPFPHPKSFHVSTRSLTIATYFAPWLTLRTTVSPDGLAGEFKEGAPSAELKVDPVYKNFMSADGYSMIATERTKDFAQKEAA
mgnify:CR=1 FL=1